jgi:Rrf2 family nitric oxide-sensitive transcriptional repressor
MRLTLHADYSLRVLLYLAENPDRAVPTREMSDAYRISKNHLVRVVQALAAGGFVEVTEGRAGGVRLLRDPASVNLGQVVRATEASFRIVECFEPETNTCPIVPVCRLRGVLSRALDGFFAVLDACTLADLVGPGAQRSLAKYLQIAKADDTADR